MSCEEAWGAVSVAVYAEKFNGVKVGAQLSCRLVIQCLHQTLSFHTDPFKDEFGPVMVKVKVYCSTKEVQCIQTHFKVFQWFEWNLKFNPSCKHVEAPVFVVQSYAQFTEWIESCACACFFHDYMSFLQIQPPKDILVGELATLY